ncbi:MAG: hypothetical protein IJ253_02025 [Bacteroidaceae bacterium]|nr:hypothetical protein [Bacteroidaceae bacterium]
MKRIFLICLLLVAGMGGRAQTLASHLQSCMEDPQSGFFVMARLMQATGLCDSVDAIRDEVYEEKYLRHIIPDQYQTPYNYSEYFYSPGHRRYGFTLFAETDKFWETTLGKSASDITPADVQEYLLSNFPLEGLTDEQYQDPQHVLYKFVSYHLLPMRLAPSALVRHVNEMGYNYKSPTSLGIPVMEYYTTMGERRLLKTYESRESGGIWLNRFPQFDNGRNGTGMEILCSPDKEGVHVDTQNAVNLLNAFFYPVDGLLAYTFVEQDNMGRERLRFDAASLFPELMSNDIRAWGTGRENVYLPEGYIEDLSAADGTICLYRTGYGKAWGNYQGDEFNFYGPFDVTLPLPPVPRRGTYEVRMGTLSNSSAGIVQVYLGTEKDNLPPIGLPIDFSKAFNDPSFYYEADSGDETYDALVDLGTRQHGVMKSPLGIMEGSRSSRTNLNCARRILTRETMEPGKTYYLRFKSVLDRSDKMLQLDYIELCPKEIYDHPYEPEDIW